MASTAQSKSQQFLEEMTRHLESYVGGLPSKKVFDKETLATKVIACHSPSNSETSSLFSTVDCSSFSSKSDASSFVKEDVSSIITLSVSSSIEFTSGSKAVETSSRLGSDYFEFSFAEGKLVGDEGDDGVRIADNKQPAANKPNSPEAAVSLQDDVYETFPVWTDRTRYCSKDVHSCINPCFDQLDSGGELRIRTSRRKKFVKSLGSVLSKHFPSSPGPTFRKSSCDKFRSRLALGNISPLSESNCFGTPLRTFERQEEKSGYSSSPGIVRRSVRSSSGNNRQQNKLQQNKMKSSAEFSASASGKTNLYGMSPRRAPMEAKALGCLGMAKTVVPMEEETSSLDGYKGPLYSASEETVHGGKTRCLPSPRLSFGSGKTSKDENAQFASKSMSVPSRTVHGHLHCVVLNNSPCFTFLVDGLEEVFVAKAVKSALDTLETGELTYVFYSWKPKGRLRGHWKNWGRKDRIAPDLHGTMTFSSRVVPSESKDGDDVMELEFVLSDISTTCSPRLSFSTWETGTSPQSSCKSPFNFPSPFSVVTPSPARVPSMTSSRYIAPTNLVARPETQPRRSKKSITSSPLRPKSDDERSSFHEPWSDSEAETTADVKDQHSELAAIVIRVPAGGNCAESVWETLNKRWCSKPLKNARKGSYGRRFSLPGRFQQVRETNENQDENSEIKSRTHSFKLRELMGDFGKEQGSNLVASTVTTILPAGNHGLPLPGKGGPHPLVERWRSGGRCDCGSWDLGCSLTILEGQQQLRDGVIKVSLQGKGKNQRPSLILGAASGELFPVSFEAPMSYLQAFAVSIALAYIRGPGSLESIETSRKDESCRPPRIPLMPLGFSHQRRVPFCSPPASLLDRL